MKRYPINLTKKIWVAITTAILITVLFSYGMSQLLYERLYVDNLEQTMLDVGRRLSLDYEGGVITDTYREQVGWFSQKSEFEVFVVENPKELSACLPFEMDHQTLINSDEREKLLRNEPVKKLGFEERFQRNILAVIIPLLEENRLEGIIYLYIPLAEISELTNEFTYLWVISAALFIVISIYLGTIFVRKLTKPLNEMKIAADQVSKGNYSVKVSEWTDDEIGQLATAFNHMARSIHEEDEKRKEFLANVSHELRTPISYINGYSEAILTNLIHDEKEKQKYVNLIHREGKRMERLVNDIFDLAKLQMDEYQLMKSPIPLAQLIEDATEKYSLIIAEKGIKFHYDLDPDIIINGDAGRIEQVIQNVTDNAIRYTSSGSIHFVLKKEGRGCKLTIRDTGCGIDEEHLCHLKERFYRVNKGRTRADGGTGLGLAICDKIVSLHGGELLISSMVGEGTKVDIILPTYNNE